MWAAEFCRYLFISPWGLTEWFFCDIRTRAGAGTHGKSPSLHQARDSNKCSVAKFRSPYKALGRQVFCHRSRACNNSRSPSFHICLQCFTYKGLTLACIIIKSRQVLGYLREFLGYHIPVPLSRFFFHVLSSSKGFAFFSSPDLSKITRSCIVLSGRKID